MAKNKATNPLEESAKEAIEILAEDYYTKLHNILSTAKGYDQVKYTPAEMPFVEMLKIRGCLAESTLYDGNLETNLPRQQHPSDRTSSIYRLTKLGRSVWEQHRSGRE